jgi:dethiobiotin synthetase
MAGKRSSRFDPGSHLPVDPPFRLFVTGTDTGVGKTEAACALLSLLARRGLGPAAFKPYETGCRDLRAPGDACALREAARSKDELELICPHRFKLPLAPGIAAHRLRREPSFQKTLRAFKAFANRPLVVEGAGGLHVPIDSQREMIDLIHLFRLPVLLVARAGLGTLNHTALSLEALFRKGVAVKAVLFSCSSPQRDPSERDNPRWIEKRHRVRILGPVPFRAEPDRRRAAFARALVSLLQE